eukprot:CAMPEP_0113452564 /NCGR_PEP_ID=MMETSP0014_2-20120614/6912_1 /TAXON_ID=2857 /ORGANISM="Nitzschia sp." /LENGTH=634 /DNA_ID=CAMNT_0000343941 /DNA_START=550 /DNA_END=2454 /DNA_ORIENTATION=+ /assembly_acc=CAM_ASM_000159
MTRWMIAMMNETSGRKATNLRFPRLAFLTALIVLLMKQASAVDQQQQQQQHEGGYLRRNFDRILSKASSHHVDHSDVDGQQHQQDERELIVGGTDAEPGRFPWFVALVNGDNETVCGGTMIAPDVVLTAAHCSAAGVRSAMVGKHFYDRNDYSDNYEWIDVQSPYDMGATTDFMQRNGHAVVDNVGFIHPYHSYRERTYDVMLLKLAKPTSTRSFIKVNFDADVPSRGTGNEITVIGMGRLDIDGPKPEVLQQVKLDFVPYDDCIDMTSYNVDYKYEVMPDMICSTGKGIYGNRGQCYGDSGGPYLVMGDTPEDDLQIGLVSWAVNCANPVLPMVGARTSMAETATFIQHVACEIGTDAPSYLCSGDASIPSEVINANQASAMINPVQLSVNLFFDPFPHEIKFQIWNADKTVSYATVSFEQHVGLDHAFHQVILPAGEVCIFSIYDARDDGIFGNEEASAYEITLGKTVILEGNGNFTSGRDDSFRVPIPSASGTIIGIEEIPATDAGAFGKGAGPGGDMMPVFVSFQFDQYHEDLSWSISDPVIVSLVYKRVQPNTYRFGAFVREEVFLPAGRSFVFTVNDRRGTDDYRAIQAYEVSYFDEQTGEEIILLQSTNTFEGETESNQFSLPERNV